MAAETRLAPAGNRPFPVGVTVHPPGRQAERRACVRAAGELRWEN